MNGQKEKVKKQKGESGKWEMEDGKEKMNARGRSLWEGKDNR